VDGVEFVETMERGDGGEYIGGLVNVLRDILLETKKIEMSQTTVQ
jgi:hypothetical protein